MLVPRNGSWESGVFGQAVSIVYSVTSWKDSRLQTFLSQVFLFNDKMDYLGICNISVHSPFSSLPPCNLKAMGSLTHDLGPRELR